MGFNILNHLLAIVALSSTRDGRRRYEQTRRDMFNGKWNNTRTKRASHRKNCLHDKTVAAKRQQRESRRINRMFA